MRYLLLFILKTSLCNRKIRKTASSKQSDPTQNDEARMNLQNNQLNSVKNTQTFFDRKDGSFCRDIGIPFPNGCIDVTTYTATMPIWNIYLEGKAIVHLFDENSMHIPLGTMMNQLHIKNSTYYICGLDFITKNLTLNLKFKSGRNARGKKSEFCFRIFKDTYIYEHQEQMPTIFPAKFFHENVYIESNKMFTLINLEKYKHIYTNLKMIHTICADQRHNTVFKTHGNQIFPVYPLNGFDIIQTSDGWQFRKKALKPLTCYVYLKWKDTYFGKQQTTVYQVTDLLELVRSFDREKIIFDFGPYAKNYKLMIVSRGFADTFCGSNIVNIDEWCLENVDQNLSSLDNKWRDYTYFMPDHDNDFVVLTFTASKPDHAISPKIRLLLSIRLFDRRFL
ncbi:hypothetical protein RF11_13572 [Thelohanellus kitauei]|uniref:Uncharacterized protein n=1 Tax=Thelohanellus kitauei TaxID=669202 RepID=A0A0C2JUG2_THEKT|nr:hypothetical protein RF11_13572 [Thelohanellus kitauei]